MAKVTYYSGTQELVRIFPIDNKEFDAKFPGQTARRCDSFSKFVGFIKDTTMLAPVTRTIEFKANPSLHKCDARCRNAKGHQCECSCRGKFHGAGGAE